MSDTILDQLLGKTGGGGYHQSSVRGRGIGDTYPPPKKNIFIKVSFFFVVVFTGYHYLMFNQLSIHIGHDIMDTQQECNYRNCVSKKVASIVEGPDQYLVLGIYIIYGSSEISAHVYGYSVI